MDTWKEIYRRAAARHGGSRALDSQLPKPKTRATLRRTPDHRYLSALTRGVFQAGFVWRVVENKWKGFEPEALGRLSNKQLTALAQDTRIIRNPQKIRAVRENARFLVELAAEYKSASRFFASWPEEDIVGLWDTLKRRGSRLGGMTGPMFLRSMGKDTPILTNDVVLALREQGVVEAKNPTSKQALQDIQTAFSRAPWPLIPAIWREESDRKSLRDQPRPRIQRGRDPVTDPATRNSLPRRRPAAHSSMRAPPGSQMFGSTRIRLPW